MSLTDLIAQLKLNIDALDKVYQPLNESQAVFNIEGLSSSDRQSVATLNERLRADQDYHRLEQAYYVDQLPYPTTREARAAYEKIKATQDVASMKHFIKTEEQRLQAQKAIMATQAALDEAIQLAKRYAQANAWSRLMAGTVGEQRAFIAKKQAYWQDHLPFVFTSHAVLVRKAQVELVELNAWCNDLVTLQLQQDSQLWTLGLKSRQVRKAFAKEQLRLFNQIKATLAATQQQIAASMLARLKAAAEQADFTQASLAPTFMQDMAALQARECFVLKAQEQITPDIFQAFYHFILTRGSADLQQQLKALAWSSQAAPGTIALTFHEGQHIGVPAFNVQHVPQKPSFLTRFFSGRRVRSTFYEATYFYEAITYNNTVVAIEKKMTALATSDSPKARAETLVHCDVMWLRNEQWMGEQQATVNGALQSLRRFGTSRARAFLTAQAHSHTTLMQDMIQAKLALAERLLSQWAEEASWLQIDETVVAQLKALLWQSINTSIRIVTSSFAVDEKARARMKALTEQHGHLQRMFYRKTEQAIAKTFIDGLKREPTPAQQAAFAAQHQSKLHLAPRFVRADYRDSVVQLTALMVGNAEGVPAYAQAKTAIQQMTDRVYSPTNSPVETRLLLEKAVKTYILPKATHSGSLAHAFIEAADRELGTSALVQYQQKVRLKEKDACVFLTKLFRQPQALATEKFIEVNQLQVPATWETIFNQLGVLQATHNTALMQGILQEAEQYIANTYDGSETDFFGIVEQLQSLTGQSTMLIPYGVKRLTHLVQTQQYEVLAADVVLQQLAEDPRCKTALSHVFVTCFTQAPALPEAYEKLITIFVTETDRAALNDYMDRQRLERYRALLINPDSQAIQQFIDEVKASELDFPIGYDSYEALMALNQTVLKQPWHPARSALLEAFADVTTTYRYRVRWLEDTLAGELTQSADWQARPADSGFQALYDYYCGIFAEDQLETIKTLLAQYIEQIPFDVSNTPALNLVTQYLKDVPPTHHPFSTLRVKWDQQLAQFQQAQEGQVAAKALLDRLNHATCDENYAAVWNAIEDSLIVHRVQADETERLLLQNLHALLSTWIEDLLCRGQLSKLTSLQQGLSALEKRVGAENTVFSIKALLTQCEDAWSLYEILAQMSHLSVNPHHRRAQAMILSEETLQQLVKASTQLKKAVIQPNLKAVEKALPEGTSLRVAMQALSQLVEGSDYAQHDGRYKQIQAYQNAIAQQGPADVQVISTADLVKACETAEAQALETLAAWDRLVLTDEMFDALTLLLQQAQADSAHYSDFHRVERFVFQDRVQTQYDHMRDTAFKLLEEIRVKTYAHSLYRLEGDRAKYRLNNAMNFMLHRKAGQDLAQWDHQLDLILLDYLQHKLQALTASKTGDNQQQHTILAEMEAIILALGSEEQQQAIKDSLSCSSLSPALIKPTFLASLQKVEHRVMVATAQANAHLLDQQLWQLLASTHEATALKTLQRRSHQLAKRVTLDEKQGFVGLFQPASQAPVNLEEAIVSISASTHALISHWTRCYPSGASKRQTLVAGSQQIQRYLQAIQQPALVQALQDDNGHFLLSKRLLQ